MRRDSMTCIRFLSLHFARHCHSLRPVRNGERAGDNEPRGCGRDAHRARSGSQSQLAEPSQCRQRKGVLHVHFEPTRHILDFARRAIEASQLVQLLVPARMRRRREQHSSILSSRLTSDFVSFAVTLPSQPQKWSSG